MLRHKLPFLLIALLLLTTKSFAQINIQWQASYDNSNSIDQSIGIVVDDAGNSFVTGTSWNGTDFDIVTIKYDPNGGQDWVSTYDGLNNFVDEARGITIDKNGFIYVTGHTNTSGASDYDIVTIKYDPANGTALWTEEFTGTGNYDQSGNITADTLGNIYVIGTLEAAAGNNDVVIIKYNSTNGNVIWSDTYDNGLSDIHFGRKIKTDREGNVYALAEVSTSSNFEDYAVIKYSVSSTGNIDWSQTYDADGATDTPKDIFIDTTGSVYVTGGSYTQNLALKEDYYTVKINGSNGNEIWDALYNGPGDDTDVAASIVSDTNGFVYITGSSTGNGTAQDFATVGYDHNGNQKWAYRYVSPGTGYDVGVKLILDDNGEIYASGTSYLSASNNDYLTLKFDSLGTKLWETRFDGPASGADNAADMWIDDGKNIYITGKSKAAATNFDYRTIKYCQLTTDAGVDTSMCYGANVQFNATGGSNFVWSVYQGDPMVIGTNFSCNNCPNPIASPDSTTTYVVSSTSGSGCVDYDTVVLVVNPLPGPVIYNDTPLDFCDGDSVRLYTDTTSGYAWSTGSDSIATTVYTSGMYSVTVVDSMGCNNSTTTNVTVYSLPTITGGTDTSLCIGDTIQLNPTGGISYVWMDDPEMSDSTQSMPLVWPSNSITYTVIGTDGNSCSDTGYVDVTVNPLPAPPTITIIGNDLVSSYTIGNQWILNGVDLAGGTGFSFTPGDLGPNGNGYYWIFYTDMNGCQSTSDSVLIDTLSLSDFDLENEFIIYPNPVENILTLNFNSAQEIATIRVVDTQGKIIFDKPMNQQIVGEYSIDCGNLPKGIYLLHIVAVDGIATKRFIKK